MRHTPGPWRVGNGSFVVSDMNDGKLVGGADDLKYYGGYLICESIATHNAKLVAEAPAMFDLLSRISSYGDAGTHNEIAELLERVNR
jgi:hypothetical protein